MNGNVTTLYAKPNFIRGAARVLDMGSTFDVYNESQSDDEADVNALRSDWEAVGTALSKAMNEYENVK